MRVPVLLLVCGALGAQVQVYRTAEGAVRYVRPASDPAFNPSGIGRPPKGANPKLWFAYDPYIRQYCEAVGVDPVLAKSVIWAESRFNWRATSRCKARGLMQVMDRTAAGLGGTRESQLGLYDPLENIRLGVTYLARLQNHYAGNLIKISAAYNAGEGAVDRHGGIPPFAETRAYVPEVLRMYVRLSSGG